MLLCKELKLNEMTSKARIPLESYSTVVNSSCVGSGLPRALLVSSCSVPRVCQFLQNLCYVLSSGTKHYATPGVASPIPCRQSDLSVQYYQWSKVDIRGIVSSPIQWVRSKGCYHLRANPRFGYSGISFPSWLSLYSANLLYK